MNINSEKKKIWTPFAPNFAFWVILVPLAPKDLGHNAPIPKDTFWA